MSGYFGLALANAAMGLAVVAMTVALDVRHIGAKIGLLRAARHRAGVIAAAFALLAFLTISALTVWEPMTQVIT
jgi:hypothetical protein